MTVLIALLRAAFQQLLVSVITERLLKDVIIVALAKISKKTDNHVDDELLEVVKRALYPDYEAGQPIDVENYQKSSVDAKNEPKSEN